VHSLISNSTSVPGKSGRREQQSREGRT
jgi:hypothetical protein